MHPSHTYTHGQEGSIDPAHKAGPQASIPQQQRQQQHTSSSSMSASAAAAAAGGGGGGSTGRRRAAAFLLGATAAALLVGSAQAFVPPASQRPKGLQQQCEQRRQQAAAAQSRGRIALAPLGSTTTPASTPVPAEKKQGGHGGGHGHGGMMGGPVDPNSFVQTELRKEAMRLHTRDQSKEGQQEAQTPFTAWEPARQDYLQFLVDSKLVYETFDAIVAQDARLAVFQNTGLERASPLAKDIEWLAATYQDVAVPEVGPYGKAYSAFIKEVHARSLPAFVCHFYNHYFAHTAGGRMIGKKMAAMLLEGHELHFYQWEGDVKEKLDAVRQSLDAMAAAWSREEKDECVAETKATFTQGGALLAYIARPPEARPKA